MGAWSDIGGMGQNDPAMELMQFRIELNRRLRHALSNISATQITSGLNDLDGTLTLAKGGTGQNLSAPAGDRILFYDLSGSKVTWLSTGNSIGITGTTLDAIQDIRTSASPTFADITGTGLIKGATGKFGNVAGGHYSEFESDGTLKFVGNATVYNDLALPIVPRTTGTGRPTLATFSGDIREFTMAINDVTDVNATELLHFWEEASEIELHVHWATNGSDVNDRYVKWQISYTWANMLASGGTTAFAAASTASSETTITAGTADKTHMYTSVVNITPSGGKIGAYLCMALKRIAASSTAPTSDPWLLAVGAHVRCDTGGSRSTASK